MTGSGQWFLNRLRRAADPGSCTARSLAALRFDKWRRDLRQAWGTLPQVRCRSTITTFRPGSRVSSSPWERAYPESGLGVAVTSLQQIGRVCVLLAFVAATPAATFGQDSVRARSLAYGSPFAGVPVLNAPFSADADIVFTRMLDDGTRIEQRAKARYYRDSAGRIRAEWRKPNWSMNAGNRRSFRS